MSAGTSALAVPSSTLLGMLHLVLRYDFGFARNPNIETQNSDQSNDWCEYLERQAVSDQALSGRSA
jgi:hypothetical protein